MSDQAPSSPPKPKPPVPPPGTHVPPKPQAAPSVVFKPGGGQWPKGLPMPVKPSPPQPHDGAPPLHPTRPSVGTLPPAAYANVAPLRPPSTQKTSDPIAAAQAPPPQAGQDTVVRRTQTGGLPPTITGAPVPPPRPAQGSLPRPLSQGVDREPQAPGSQIPPKPGSIGDIPGGASGMPPVPKKPSGPPALTQGMPEVRTSVPYKPMSVPKSSIPFSSGLPVAVSGSIPPTQLTGEGTARGTTASSSSAQGIVASPQIPTLPSAQTTQDAPQVEKPADFDRLAVPAPPSFLPTLPSLPPAQTSGNQEKKGNDSDVDADWKQYLSSDTDESATGATRKGLDPSLIMSVDSGMHFESLPLHERSPKREDDPFGSSSSDGENDERRQGQDLALLASKDSKRASKRKARQKSESDRAQGAKNGESDGESQWKSDAGSSPKVRPKSKGSMLKKLWTGKTHDGIQIVEGTPMEPLDELPEGARDVMNSAGVDVTKVGLNGKAYPRKLVFNESNQSVMILGGKHPIHHPCSQITSYIGGATEELTKYGLKTPADRSKVIIFRTGQRCYSFLCSRKETAEMLGMVCTVLGNAKNSKGKAIKLQEYPDGSRYRGEMSSGLRHGSGTLIMSDGATYEAQWADDKREGWGKEVHSDGTSFEGFYSNGQRHGRGSMTWFDSSKYEGDFENGRASGEGKLQRADGSHYAGQFYHDCMHGEGIMKWPDGVQYQGQFIRNKRDGNGRMEWAGGKWRMYTGQWRSGMQHGEGTLVSHDSQSYLGVFYEGKLERWLDV